MPFNLKHRIFKILSSLFRLSLELPYLLKRSVGRTDFLNGMEKRQGTFVISNQME